MRLILPAVASGSAQEPSASQPQPPPPAAKSGAPKHPKANNRACLVCHVNFETEKLAASHAQGGIGCVDCHGKSRAHVEDESNVIPPDIMFAKSKINAACLKCHPKQKSSVAQVGEPVTAKPKKKYCTECHGEHRMSFRTRRWDPETGKLLPDEPKARVKG